MNDEQRKSIRNEYLEHILAQKASGLSISKYCVEKNINLNKFYHYQSYRPASAKPKSANNFTQVKINPNENHQNISSSKTELLQVVKLNQAIDPVWLAKFLFTLNNCK